MAQKINIAEYLFQRFRQLGIQSIFGVPGDYNLTLLDYVEPAGLRWVRNCNELNAAYAADGYARNNGLGTLVTTFVVGELSAANGIAGAYAEKAPVVHVVCTPSRALQKSRALRRIIRSPMECIADSRQCTRTSHRPDQPNRSSHRVATE